MAYTWDRANRLLSHDGISYTYDGLGNRVSQTSGSTLTEYLIDQQPGLAVVLRQKIGSQNTHYVHGLRGIHAHDDGTAWIDYLSDGLGSVRGWLDGSQAFVDTMGYNPYGVPHSAVDGYGFTGEMTDANELVYLRARYYAPEMGSFINLDPFRGKTCSPMTLHGYGWVEGNVANRTDPRGMCSINRSATSEQRSECANIQLQYQTYLESIYGPMNTWSPSLNYAVYQDLQYWGSLSYEDFIARWNDNQSYPPGVVENNQAGQILSGGATLALGASAGDGPLPVGDIVGIIILTCAVGLTAYAASQTLTLLTRPYINFSDTSVVPRSNQGVEAISRELWRFFSMDGDRAIPIPIPIPEPKPNEYCEPLPGLQTCESLPTDFKYHSFEQALKSEESKLQIDRGALNFRLRERLEERQSTDNYCIGWGSHSQFYDADNNYIGSITCCQCCDDYYSMAVRCFFNSSRPR